MKIRLTFVAAVVAFAGLFPLAGPAHATHSCGFEPCPHPEDVRYVTEFLCNKYPILSKYTNLICG